MTKWWLIGSVALLGILLIASIALALMSEETEFAPGTPEAAVQTALRAAESDDIETVYGLLSQDLLQKCTLEGFVADGGFRYSDRDEDFSAMLDDTKFVNDTAIVSVKVTRYYGSAPFDISESTYDERFTLRQEADAWKFIEYPWPYHYCDESDNERIRQPAMPTPVEPSPTPAPE